MIETNDQSVRLRTYEGNSQPPNTTPPALLPSEGLNPAIDTREQCKRGARRFVCDQRGHPVSLWSMDPLILVGPAWSLTSCLASGHLLFPPWRLGV